VGRSYEFRVVTEPSAAAAAGAVISSITFLSVSAAVSLAEARRGQHGVLAETTVEVRDVERSPWRKFDEKGAA
jgi:hypothetical protein